MCERGDPEVKTLLAGELCGPWAFGGLVVELHTLDEGAPCEGLSHRGHLIGVCQGCGSHVDMRIRLRAGRCLCPGGGRHEETDGEQERSEQGVV